MWRLISAVCLVCLVPVRAVSPDDAVFLGCYSTQFVKSNPYYEVKIALSWYTGIQLCIDRLTMFVGVQAKSARPHHITFYCGNELSQLSTQVGVSQCFPCSHDYGNLCGGRNTMSVYKLRDSTPLAVLLAADSEVRLLIDDSYSIETKMLLSLGAHDIDYVYSEDEILLRYISGLYSALYNYFTPVQRTTSLILSNSNKIGDIAIDWVKPKVYLSYIEDHNIYNVELDGTTRLLTAGRSNAVTDLVIDPYLRKLFFIEDGTLFYQSLRNGMNKRNNGNMYMVNVAIDHHEQQLYVIGQTFGDTRKYYLERLDYKFTKSELLFNGTELTSPYGLDVFRGVAVWVNFDGSQFSVYKCKLTPKCNTTDLNVIHRTAVVIYDVKIYHPERQTPSKLYLCENFDCSHSCEQVSLFAASCSCPSGILRGRDNKTCEGYKVSTQEETIQESDNKMPKSRCNHKNMTFFQISHIVIFLFHLGLIVFAIIWLKKV